MRLKLNFYQFTIHNIELMDFLFTPNSYNGKFTPENLVFNANLQEFTHQVSLICELSTQGVISPESAYTEIQVLFESLKRSKQQLKIGENP
jgi:hypothetical protein